MSWTHLFAPEVFTLRAAEWPKRLNLIPLHAGDGKHGQRVSRPADAAKRAKRKAQNKARAATKQRRHP